MDIAILLLLIVLNGVFAMSEMAVVASRRARLSGQATGGHKGAAAALALAESPTRFLSTVQIGITLIGILAGAFGEAALAKDLAGFLRRFAWLAGSADLLATVLVVLCITYLSLVLGELVPKRLALSRPERIASAVAIPMGWLARIASPVVTLLSFSTDLIVRTFRAGAAEQESVTQEEIEAMLVQGAATGVLEPQEHKIVERVFRLADQRLSSVMTPRTDIVWLDADASPERVRIVIATESHSHFPVCEGSLDKLLGVVHVKDLVKNGLVTGSVELRPLVRPPLFLPESSSALNALELFRVQRTHVAFVLDEYGALEGLVTLGDIMEGIVGEMVRTGEESDPQAVQRDEHSWLLDGMLGIDELREIMGVSELPKQQETSYQTVSGLVMVMLGRIPSAGESFTWRNFHFEVVDMDRQRVDKVLLTIKPEEEQPSDAAL